MPTCVLRYCKSRSSKTTESGHSFFSFPPVNNKVREKWIRFVQSERREVNWLPSVASKLCSKHFRIKDIQMGKTGRNILKKGSIPYLAYEGNETKANTPKPVDVDVSEAECVLDSSIKVSLKSKVRSLQKQKVRHQAKIKKITQHNRCLKIKISKLKNMLRALINKFDLQTHLVNPHKAGTKTQDIGEKKC